MSEEEPAILQILSQGQGSSQGSSNLLLEPITDIYWRSTLSRALLRTVETWLIKQILHSHTVDPCPKGDTETSVNDQYEVLSRGPKGVSMLGD